MEKKYRVIIYMGHAEADSVEVVRILKDLCESIESHGLDYTDLRDSKGDLVGNAFIQERMI